MKLSVKWPVKTLSKRERRLLFIILLLAFAAGNFLFLRPLFGKWRRLGEELSLKEVKLKKGGEIIAQQKALEEEFSKLKMGLDSSLSREERVSDLFKEVESLAQRSGISILKMQPQRRIEETDLFEQLSVELNFAGDISGAVKFLYNLKQHPRALDVRSLRLRPEKNLLQGEIVVATIYLKDKE